ncbi:MAG: InlB B-repeat-containing protein [Gammaproteobacteria bacterium]
MLLFITAFIALPSSSLGNDQNATTNEILDGGRNSDAINQLIAPAFRLLTISKTSGGKVTSSPPGIDCGAQCSYYFFNNTTVHLNALPDPVFLFDRWTGACETKSPCDIIMDDDKSSNAYFVINYPVIKGWRYRP